MLRNGADGYGWLTKSLHWVTVLALLAQFVLGYVMDPEDGDDPLLLSHVSLGILIISLAIARLAWRRLDALPPWADQLSARQRHLSAWTERCLLVLMIVVPATGIMLLLDGDGDLLWLHVAGHVVFFAVLAVHVALVVTKRLLPRML